MQQLILANINMYFNISWYLTLKDNGRLMSVDRSLLSGCIIEIDFLGLDHFSDYFFGKLIEIDRIIN